jgi:YVTN family beta-propeller protein
MAEEDWIHQQFTWVMIIFGSPSIFIFVTWVFIQIYQRMCCFLPCLLSCLQSNAPTAVSMAVKNEGIMQKIKSVVQVICQTINQCFATHNVIRGYMVAENDGTNQLHGIDLTLEELQHSKKRTEDLGDVELAERGRGNLSQKPYRIKKGNKYLTGVSLEGMVKTPDGKSVYLLHPVKRRIYKINPITNKCVAAISLDGRSTSRVVKYCCDIIDCLGEAMSDDYSGTANTVAGSTPADEWQPKWLKITPDGSKFLVIYHQQNQNNNNSKEHVSIIDRKTKKVTPKFELPVSGEPIEIAISPYSTEAYLMMPEGRIVVIDLQKNEVKVNRGLLCIEAGPDLQKIMIAPDGTVYSFHATEVKRVNDDSWKMDTILKGVSSEGIAFREIIREMKGFGFYREIWLYFIDLNDGSIKVATEFGKRIGRIVDEHGNLISMGKKSQEIAVGADGSWVSTLDKERGQGNWLCVDEKNQTGKEIAEDSPASVLDQKYGRGNWLYVVDESKIQQKERKKKEKSPLLESQSNHKVYWSLLHARLEYFPETPSSEIPSSEAPPSGAPPSGAPPSGAPPSSGASSAPPSGASSSGTPSSRRKARMTSDGYDLLVVDPDHQRFAYSDSNGTVCKDKLPFRPYDVLLAPADLNKRNRQSNILLLLMAIVCIGMAFVLNSFITPRMFSSYQMRLLGMALWLGSTVVILSLMMVVTQKPIWKIAAIVLGAVSCLVAFAGVVVIWILTLGHPQAAWEQMVKFLVILLLFLLIIAFVFRRCGYHRLKSFLFLVDKLLLIVIVVIAIALIILSFISINHTVLMIDLGRDRILVYNTGAKQVSTTISTGEGLSWLAVTPDKTTAYATNQGSGTVSMIDLATYQVKENITVGGEPTYVAISPDGRAALVSISNGTNGIVAAIDLSTNQVVANISVAMSPEKIVWADDPKVARACVLSESGRVYVMDTAINKKVEEFINVGPSARDAAIDSVGMRAYMTSGGNNSVTVINIGNAAFVEVIPVGVDPWGVLLLPEEKLLYVANFGSDTVSVISTTNNSFIMNITVGDGPIQLITNPDKTLIYVAEMNGETVSVIDRETHQVIAAIWLPTHGDVWGIAISPDSSLVIVTHEDIESITVVTTLTDYAEEVKIDGNAYEAVFVN